MTNKFKVGDEVRRIEQAGPGVTVGKSYIIKDINIDVGELMIKNDRGIEEVYDLCLFELLASAPFSVGDKIRRVTPKVVGAITEGCIYTVQTPHHTIIGQVTVLDDFGWPEAFDTDRFTLVESANPKPGDIMEYKDKMTTEEIVKRLNEYERLAQGIKKTPGIIESSLDNGNSWKDVSNRNTYPLLYRLTPKKPKILQLTSWSCELQGNSLRVGCQKFDAKTTLFALSSLVRNNLTSKGDLTAARGGVVFQGYLLPWTDAEKLLAFLEENKV